MKKTILFAMLCMICAAVKAQPTVDNSTNCTLMVTTFCYSTNCTMVSNCGTKTVPPLSTGTALSVCTNCNAPNLVGYRICCGANCVAVTDGGSSICAQIPQTNTLNGCPCQATINIQWSGGILKLFP